MEKENAVGLPDGGSGEHATWATAPPMATDCAPSAPAAVAFGGDLLRRIKSNGTELSIEEMGLTSLPTAGYPESVTRLDASANELTTVPDALALSLPLLRSIDVSKNGLRALPANLCECAELQSLKASHNGLLRLDCIPFPLQRLVELHADKNSLSELPPCLWLCPRLKHVSLCANRLGMAALAMPAGADGAGDGGPGGGGSGGGAAAAAVAPLELLDLGENRLGALPPLGLFPNLREVRVQQNGIRELPVAQITPLVQLQTLDISMNDVSLLPPALARLPSLQHLSITGNPIRSIPRSVQEGGSSAVIELLRKRLPVET